MALHYRSRACPHGVIVKAMDYGRASRKLAYVPGPTFGFMKLLASSGSHCTKWADEQHRQAGFESRLVPDLPLPFIPTLIGLRAFDLVSSRVWWEAATNTDYGIVVSEFVLQSRYYVNFQANTLEKGMNPLILQAMG